MDTLHIEATENVPDEVVLVDEVVGNIEEPVWHTRVDDAIVDVLALDQWDAQKSRLRRRSKKGVDLAISLERGSQLRDGDVLLWDPDSRSMTIVHITLQDVMEIDLSALAAETTQRAVETSIELGHALGNQHWPAVVKGMKVYVPLTVDKAVMRSVMKTHGFEGITYDFRPGAEIIPYLAPHESRRLFGAASQDGHGHTHDHHS